MSDMFKLMTQRLTHLDEPTASYEGRNVIVTGANVGLGFETALKFVQLGAAKTILAVRSIEKGNAAKKAIEDRTGRNDAVEVWQLNMLDYESIKTFAKKAETLDHLDVVVLNAGVMRIKFEESKYGWEEDLQVNVLSTTLLAVLLFPKLEASQSAGFEPSMIFVSSGMHKSVKPRIADGNLLEEYNTAKGFDGFEQYAISKLFVMAVVKKMARMLKSQHVKSAGVCPGAAVSDLARDYRTFPVGQILSVIHFLIFGSAEEGARTFVNAITKGDNGAFYKDNVNEE
jgi:NAD(P)-dependent dehydrogenase (short-subunit alcohol dehydrogenase family)